MEPQSELVELYVALYGQMPTSHTTIELLRLERFFQLSRNDPLAQMVVMILRAADLMHEEASRRTKEERGFIEELKSLSGSLKHLMGTMDRVRHTVGSRARRVVPQMTDDQIVPVGRSASPLFGYLRYAFYSQIGPMDDDERIVAARWDLSLMAGILTVALAVGAVFGRSVAGGHLPWPL